MKHCSAVWWLVSYIVNISEPTVGCRVVSNRLEQRYIVKGQQTASPEQKENNLKPTYKHSAVMTELRQKVNL